MGEMQAKLNLDLMRSVAVLAVFIDHVTLLAGVDVLHGWNLRWLGVFGVYLFFVHTCLVLMWSLERRPHTLDFYVRRIFRIYPLAIFTVLLAIALRLPYFDPHILSFGLIFSNLFLIQNLWIHENLLGVFWSLPLEVDMYLLLPALFLFARKESAIWPFLVFWAFACAADHATYGRQGGNGLFAVIPHFLPGIMAYVGFKRYRPRLPAGLFAVLLVLLLAFFEYRPSVVQGWFVCLALGLLLPHFRDLKNSIVAKVSHTIATYSYGIYLLHLVALWFGFVLLKGHSLWLRMFVTLSTLALMSWASYHFIESPFMHLGSRVANRLQTRFGTSRAEEYGLDLA